MKFAAIILSAGFSSRLHIFKPLAQVGSLSLLQRAIGLFQDKGPVWVVIGHNRHLLEPIIEAAGARPVYNPDYASGMFSSVRAGVAALHQAGKVNAFWVLPVDSALVKPSTINSLAHVFAHDPDPKRIVIPAFDHKPGHPPLIGGSHLKTISHWRGRDGLRGCLAQYNPQLVPLPDKGILSDLDTPALLGKAQRLFAHAARLPLAEEVQALYDLYADQNSLPGTKKHCRAVARLALKLGRACRRQGQTLDLPLLAYAALLHDLLRHEKQHALQAGQLLRKMGWPELGQVVAGHMELPPGPRLETELLFLADKLVSQDKMVSLEERFNQKAQKMAGNEEALAALQKRRRQALLTKERIEHMLGQPWQAVI